MLHGAHRSSERVGTRFWFSRGRAVSASWLSWPRALTPATISGHRQPRGRYGVVLDRACARSATRLCQDPGTVEGIVLATANELQVDVLDSGGSERTRWVKPVLYIHQKSSEKPLCAGRGGKQLALHEQQGSGGLKLTMSYLIVYRCVFLC